MFERSDFSAISFLIADFISCGSRLCPKNVRQAQRRSTSGEYLVFRVHGSNMTWEPATILEENFDEFPLGYEFRVWNDPTAKKARKVGYSRLRGFDQGHCSVRRGQR